MLAGTLGLALAPDLSRGAPPKGLTLGRAHEFSFELLKKQAKSLAAKPYAPPNNAAASALQSIDFDLAQKIKFKPEFGLWQNGHEEFPVRFFPLNRYVTEPVRIYGLSGNAAREIIYSNAYFNFGGTGLEKKLPGNAGFSGFRAMNGQTDNIDWLAFQGASYFRSAGGENQYGASARGIAVDTALSTKEEFPSFTSFWLAQQPGQKGLTVYALLEGPSLTGAYKIDATRGDGVITEVHAQLFVRADIERLGMAPLTSMYWYSEANRRQGSDWRPEIHDSDGLALWTGKDEHIWRPLTDPPSLQVNSFVDANPKGFGLMQRDRNFADYQDDGAFYNRRPSLWVEPIGNWGEGAVQLVEIPTNDEIHDNIVAYWQPKAPVASGAALSFDYRLFWRDREPSFPPSLARVVATRIGRGGVPGRAPPPNTHKFVVDFEGGPLAKMAPRYDVTPVTSLSRGKADNAYVIKIVGTERWRAFFDVAMDGGGPLDLRCFLKLGDKTLSETWLYQFFPPVA